MQNYLTEKMLLDTRHGSNCALGVCTAGDPDKDIFLMTGTASDCLRKTMTHKLNYSGDEYFCLFTKQNSYCGTSFDDISWRMGYNPSVLRDVLDHKPSLEEQIGFAVEQIMEDDKLKKAKSAVSEIGR